MGDTARAILLGWLVLATSVWIGGYVAIAVVARVAARAIDAPARIALFRGLGRAYGIIGLVALLVALATGGALVTEHAWDATLITAVVLAAAVLAATLAGMVQARRMTRLRRAALADRTDTALAERVRHGARDAAVLRAAIGLLSLALIAVGALLAT